MSGSSRPFGTPQRQGDNAPTPQDQAPGPGVRRNTQRLQHPTPLDIAPRRPEISPSSKSAKGGRRSPVSQLPRSDEVSAGGLVVNRSLAEPAAALIGRFDRRGRLLWSLPKGHLEAGETREQAAIREVEEETGIRGNVVAPLGTIRYWFVAEGRRVHKTVHHYLMQATGGELSDEDAEVVAVAWVPLSKLGTRLAYADERKIADAAVRILADTA